VLSFRTAHQLFAPDEHTRGTSSRCLILGNFHKCTLANTTAPISIKLIELVSGVGVASMISVA
jgi:hypothetical protein